MLDFCKMNTVVCTRMDGMSIHVSSNYSLVSLLYMSQVMQWFQLLLPVDHYLVRLVLMV